MIRKLGFSRATRGPFWRAFILSFLKNPRSIRYVGALLALYVHFGPFSRYVAQRIREAIAREERCPSPVAPPPAPVAARAARREPALATQGS
jgi:hypothetical protein